MSTYGLHRQKSKSSHLFASAAFSILLVALQLTLFSTSSVFASSVHRAANAAPPENVARAGVSVVRLLVTYSTLTTPATTIQCTGLGTIVASWPMQNAPDQNTWVLTDGLLVNPDGEASCASAHPKARLVMIEVILSSAYNPQAVPVIVPIPPNASSEVHCSTAGACQDGAALFAFSTLQTLPFIDLTSLNILQAQPVGIELSKTATSLEVPHASNTDQKSLPLYPDQMLQSITPLSLPLGNGTAPTNMDLGLPLVDPRGHLVSIAIKNSLTLFSTQDISTFMTQQIKLPAQHDNPVQKSWDAGITAFYAGSNHYTEAKGDFNAVLASNSQFLGAQTFLQLMSPSANLTPAANTGGANMSGKTEGGISFFGIHIPGSLVPVLWGVVILLVLILAAVIIVALRVRRQPQPMPEFQKEWAEAERIASATLEEEMRKIDEAWTQQQAQTQRAWSEQPSRVPETVPFASTRLGADQLASSDPLCPNCGKPAPKSAKYCPSCRWLLSSSKSEAQPSIQLPATGPVRPDAVAEPRVPASLPTLPAPEQPQRSDPTAPLYPVGLPSLPIPAREVVENKW